MFFYIFSIKILTTTTIVINYIDSDGTCVFSNETKVSSHYSITVVCFIILYKTKRKKVFQQTDFFHFFLFVLLYKV